MMLTVPIMRFPPDYATNHDFRLLRLMNTDMITNACPGPDRIDMSQACGLLVSRI
jgi:hypothetical protein